jgi:alanyl-tRNA synthetase
VEIQDVKEDTTSLARNLEQERKDMCHTQKLGMASKGTKYIACLNFILRSMESSAIPHTAIKRYPVVARWRADVDYVAAGIYCFQPYCVTGELEPPANPLICPQFCLRFNDLDSVGLSGRHYSGFIMLGIQVFNKPDKYVT